MARKLRSDRLLFLATSARLRRRGDGLQRVGGDGAWNASSSRISSCSSRRHGRRWACLLLGLLMRVDYRNYRQPMVIWTAFGGVALALIAVLFSPEINGRRRWFGCRRHRRAAVGAGEDRRHLLHRGVARAAHGSHQRHRVRAGADRGDGRRARGIDPPQPDFGTAFSLLLTVAVMVFAAGSGWRYIVGRGAGSRAARRRHRLARAVPPAPRS